MTAKEHNKLLGWLFLGLGGLELFSNIFSVFYIPFSFGNAIRDLKRVNPDLPSWLENLSYYLVIFIIFSTVFLTLPKFVAALGILKGKSWGRLAGIIAGAVSLLAIPIGTVLGAYAIWFFTSEKGKEFYLSDGNQSQTGAQPASPQ